MGVSETTETELVLVIVRLEGEAGEIFYAVSKSIIIMVVMVIHLPFLFVQVSVGSGMTYREGRLVIEKVSGW